MDSCWSYSEVIRTDFALFSRMKSKLVKMESQLNFLITCKRQGLTPKSIQVSTKFHTSTRMQIIENCNNKLLKAAIKEKVQQLEQLKKDMYYHHLYLAQKFHPIMIMREITYIERNLTKLKYALTKAKAKKIERMKLKTEQKRPKPNDVSYSNFSNVQIPPNIDNILRKGPKYAYCNNRDVKMMVLALEKTLDKVPGNEKHTTRATFAHLLNKHLSHKKQDIKIQRKEVKELKAWTTNNNIMILKADKTSQIVIMDKSEHEQKISDYIKDSKSKTIKMDPTKNAVRSIKMCLDDPALPICIKEKGNPCYNPSVPLLFTQVKTHKDNRPIRPMIARYTAPTHNLEKALTKYLSPYVFDKEYVLKSTSDFINKVRVNHNQELIMASLDVVALYPSTPVTIAINLLTNRLKEYNLDINTIAALMKSLRVCCEFNFFRHEHQIYKQTCGAPIGASPSGLLAEIVLQNAETTVLKEDKFKDVIIYRYVDDIFLLAKSKETIIELASRLSSIYETINYTYEMEENSSISFLDVKIIRKPDNFEFEVYRKACNSPIYIPYNASQPWKYKMSAFKWLIKRSEIICSSEENKNKEMKMITKLAESHGYTMTEIEKYLQKEKKQQQTEGQAIFIKFPYTKGLSENVQRILKKHNIKVVHVNRNSIFDIVRKDRDMIDLKHKPGVYTVPIKNLDNSNILQYIGKTKVSVDTRIKQHISEVKKGEYTNSIYKYLSENNAIPIWKDTRILRTNTNNYDLLRLEAYEMITANNLINNQEGLDTPAIWKSIILKYK